MDHLAFEAGRSDFMAPRVPSKPSKPILPVVDHANTTGGTGFEGFEGDLNRCLSENEAAADRGRSDPFGRLDSTYAALTARSPEHVPADRWQQAVQDEVDQQMFCVGHVDLQWVISRRGQDRRRVDDPFGEP